jgi:hypothetical protein
MSSRAYKPREWRRRVLIPAHIRVGLRWKEAWILNLSSRGMLIRSLDPLTPGSTIELRRSDRLIRASVVWRHGTCAGLRSEERLIVAQILSDSGEAVAAPWSPEIASAQTQAPPARADSRVRGRLLQFAGTAALALVLAVSVVSIAEQALARPLAVVRAALSAR